jgi:hypothetical protein
MGKRLDELNLGSEEIEGVTQEDLPEQFGARPDPPQPGAYRFRLPEDMATIYDTFEPTINDQQVTRVSAIFDEACPLLIVQSPKGEHNEEPFEARISNAERKRDKAGTMASDMDYLLAKAFDVKLPGKRSNQWYVQRMQELASKEFSADIEFQWFCNPKRDLRVADGNGGVAIAEGRTGCGARYYQNDVPQEDDGTTPVRIECSNPECGGQIRAFPQLTRYRP